MLQRSGKLEVSHQNPDHACQSRLTGFLKKFAKDEDGVLVIFGVYIFIMIIMMGGIGIDLMRFERDRASLQSTLDRAVLAAADLDQTLDPAGVVADYFNKAGLSEFLVSVTVDEGLGYRVVSAEASKTVRTQFMHMTGVDTLEVPASSIAEERIDGVEISLVLDVSGSMRSNNRLANLKIAARDFIDTMMDNSQEGKVSISIVPYATQVSVPQFLMDEFNVTNEHNYSRCINFQSSDFSTTAMDTSALMQRTMHFDPWSNFDGRSYDPKRLVSSPICEEAANREIMVMQKNRSTLKSFINNLNADGNTSIDIGMKWGAALLDPSLDGVIDNLISGNHVSADFAARPHAYDDGETIKIIVLMTDGQNTDQYYLNNSYKTGNSNVWWNDAEEEYSIYNPSNGQYFWPRDNNWHSYAYGNGTSRVCTNYYYDYYGRRRCGNWQYTSNNAAAALSYVELWARTSLQWNLYNHYYPWMNSSSANSAWYWNVFNSVGGTSKNTRTDAICDAVKENSVIVFTIGFEAPSNGVAVLRDCASSPSHYFDVTGLEIVDAFSAIASSIRQLRLTQ